MNGGMVVTNIVLVVAKAMYESHGFKKSWDHPDTVRLWHPIKIAEASAAIKAYHGALRSAGKTSDSIARKRRA